MILESIGLKSESYATQLHQTLTKHNTTLQRLDINRNVLHGLGACKKARKRKRKSKREERREKKRRNREKKIFFLIFFFLVVTKLCSIFEAGKLQHIQLAHTSINNEVSSNDNDDKKRESRTMFNCFPSFRVRQSSSVRLLRILLCESCISRKTTFRTLMLTGIASPYSRSSFYPYDITMTADDIIESSLIFSSPFLHWYSIQGNPLEDRTTRQLVKGLATNRSLQVLDLQRCPIAEDVKFKSYHYRQFTFFFFRRSCYGNLFGFFLRI